MQRKFSIRSQRGVKIQDRKNGVERGDGQEYHRAWRGVSRKSKE